MLKSSPKILPEEFRLIDAVVLAGSKGARSFNLGSGCVEKPILPLGGVPMVQHVVGSLLESKRIGSVFVVGNVALLEKALGRHFASPRVKLVEEGADILINCLRAYFSYLLPEHGYAALAFDQLEPNTLASFRSKHPELRDLPALFITADLPFLSKEAVDRFLEASPDGQAVVFGVVDYRYLQMLHPVLEEDLLENWKLGAFHLRKISIRLNNMFLVRPLLCDPVLYQMVQGLYAHRWLLGRGGSIKWKNWWAGAKIILRYSLKGKRRLKFLRGLINFVPALGAMLLARITHPISKYLSWPFRIFLGKKDLETIGSLMIGASGFITITQDPGPAIDIDVEESYRFLSANQDEKFHQIQHHLTSKNDPAYPGPKNETG